MNFKEEIKKWKNQIDIHTLLIFAIIAVIFFGMLVSLEYATDTYAVFAQGARVNAMHFMGSGRFVTAVAMIIARILCLSETQIYFISYLLAVISLIVSLYELEKIISKDVNKKNISILISTLIILNAFIIELFLFIEKGILVFSILLNVLAIKYIVAFFEKNNWKDFLKVLIFMFLANGAYQGTVGLFIAVSLVYIIKYSKEVKTFIKNNVVVAVGYAVPAILDLIVAKMFGGSRVSGNIEILESIKKIIVSSKNMLATYNILPKYLFLTVTIVVIICLIYMIIKSNNTTKAKLLKLLSIVYISLGTIVVAILPQIMQNTDAIWVVPRSTYTFASLIGILILHLFVNCKDNIEYETNINKIIILISILYIVVQYISFVKVEISRYKLNELDKEISLNIKQYVQEYEESSGNTISKLAIYNDKSITYTYEDIFITGDMNIRAYATDWSTTAILKYYLDRDLEIVPKVDTISEQFESQDWNYFNEKQLVFEGDTLHICCY